MTVNQARQLISSYERGQAIDKELYLSLYLHSIRGNARREIIKYLIQKEDKQC